MEKYNLIYEKEDGSIVYGRRLKHIRRIELENGRQFSHSWASVILEYKGKRGDSRTQAKTEYQSTTTPNGFKITKKVLK